MLPILFIIGLSCTGISARYLFDGMDSPERTCDPEKCHKIAPAVQPGISVDILPDEEKLNEMCPSLLSFLACYNDSTPDCFGHDMFDVLEYEVEMNAALAKFYLGVTDMFTDLCNVDSDLHKRYSSNVECIREVVFSPRTALGCRADAIQMLHIHSLSSQSEGITREKEYSCLRGFYLFSCVIRDIFRECGEEARSTVVAMVKRSKVARLVCPLKYLPDDLEILPDY